MGRLGGWTLLLATLAIVGATRREPGNVPEGSGRAISRSEIVFEWREDLWSLDIQTNVLANLTITPGAQERMPALSPDGRRVAYVDFHEAYLDSEIAILDLATGRSRSLTANVFADLEPAWSPDGTRLAWIQDRGDGAEMVVAEEDGKIVLRLSSEENRLTGVAAPAWSPAGRQLAFSATSQDRSGDQIFLYDLEARSLTWLAEGAHPVWSPDGERLAFVRETLGHPPEIFLLEPGSRNAQPFDRAPERTSSIERLWWTRQGLFWLEKRDPAASEQGTEQTELASTELSTPQWGDSETQGERTAHIVGPNGTVAAVPVRTKRAASAIPNALRLDPRCQIAAVVLQDKYSSWVQFKATLTGDCGFDPNLGTHTSVQYFVDGREIGDRMGVHPPDFECRNTSGPVITEGPSVNWFFPSTGGHTLGARVVEWANRPREGRVCDSFSDIVSRGVNISIPSGDSDADGISNSVENHLINHFQPTFKLDPTEPAPQSNLESVTVRVGPTLPRVATPTVTRILMNYNVLWWTETGDCITAHAYDTEPMGYYLTGGSTPYSTSGWSVFWTRTIAHDGTACERVMTSSGYVNPVYVGQGKHGNFLTASCDNWFCCNQCSASGPELAYVPHQVGNGRNYPGNCGHNRHLVNGNFLVPEKWGSLFSSFALFSPFPP